ncbi:hypothetical protein PQU96_04940 [Vogesella sp. LYT5W]|uniref:Uncharacterized protein n=1 Tax=Vogesella margarita TaxID=2984199 RepID=A0ABT5ILP4_9NEIS|nr:hypothetical protein [Vogesella margarita]MDC7713486.1 hypothetical protein [Vogesella margarita]
MSQAVFLCVSAKTNKIDCIHNHFFLFARIWCAGDAVVIRIETKMVRLRKERKIFKSNAREKEHQKKPLVATQH